MSSGTCKSKLIEENIRVFIRQRPSNRADTELSDLLDDDDTRDAHAGGGSGSNNSASVQLSGDGHCSLVQASGAMGQAPRKESFKFDGCFLPGSTQQDVFQQAAQPIVESALLGYSGTIFAYGPTNSGKTYTMRGTEESGQRGVMERCIDQLLAASQDQNQKVELWVSYLQIYCEMITDLLDIDGDSSGDAESGYLNSGAGSLTIREKEGKVHVEGLKRIPLRSRQDFHDVLAHGDANKVMAQTNMNAASSRSHTALMITINIPDAESATTESESKSDSNARPYKAYKESTLFLVDLAGSERASASAGHQFQRREESKAINLSLSSLGNCMNALAEKRKHIPYRDSKLTRLLQGSLGGGARTSVIVTIPPGDKESDKLLVNVFRFASRAVVVKVAAKVSRYVDYESLYNLSIKKLDALEDAKNAGIVNVSVNEDLQDKVERQSDEIASLHKEIALMKAQNAAASNASVSNSNNNNTSTSNSVDTGGYDPSFGSRNRNTSTNSSIGGSGSSGPNSSDPIAVEKYWREQMQSTTDKAVEDMKATRSKLEAKIRTLNKTIDAASSEVMELQNDLTEERTNHLATVQQVKQYQSKLTSTEADLEGRVAELLNDRNELCEVLENERNNSRNMEEKVADMQTALMQAETAGEEMIPKSQFSELENLFTETVERLTTRVIGLEERSTNAALQPSNNSNTNSRNGSGSRNNNNYGGDNGSENKYGLSLSGSSTNSRRIQPGGRVVTNSRGTNSAPQQRGAAPSGGSRW